ncbi:hypothetical protein D3C86_1469130 [compost metagenome]
MHYKRITDFIESAILYRNIIYSTICSTCCMYKGISSIGIIISNIINQAVINNKFIYSDYVGTLYTHRTIYKVSYRTVFKVYFCSCICCPLIENIVTFSLIWISISITCKINIFKLQCSRNSRQGDSIKGYDRLIRTVFPMNT